MLIVSFDFVGFRTIVIVGYGVLTALALDWRLVEDDIFRSD